MNQKTAVVILNWNGRKFLERFLPSVVRHSGNASIFVADNGSTDDSVDFIKNAFPEIKILSLERNFGFCKGYNMALSQIQAEYFVLLNSDVEVPAGWLQPLISLMEENPEIGVCQPKIKDLTHRNLFEYAGAAGGFIDTLGYPFCRGRIFEHLEEDKGQYDSGTEIFWASGACFVIRSLLFRETGGFDERFFAHMEEIDLCWRIQKKGYKIYCCPDSEVYHLGGGSLSKTNPRKTYLNFRNNLMMLLKNLSGMPFVWVLLARLLLDGLAGLKFISEGRFRHCLAIIKAHFYCYSNIIRILRRRSSAPAKEIRGIYQGSILKVYYVDKIRTFSELKF